MGQAFDWTSTAAWAGPAGAFFQVVLIDLTLAADNAVAVGMAAAALPTQKRHRAIFLGLAAAVVMLSGFALFAIQLLKIVGLLIAGGVLLLLVSWRMWRDLHFHHLAPLRAEGPLRPKTMIRAMLQILIADVSMSLDNVVAVAGAARNHPWVLVFGLMLSITLTGFAAAGVARLLRRAPWIGYIGLGIVVFVALRMIWDGSRGMGFV